MKLEDSVSVRLSLYPNVQNSNVETVREIQIDPQPFLHSFLLLHLFHKGMTDSYLLTISIPPIQNFLQLGDNLSLPLNNRLNLTVDLIKLKVIFTNCLLMSGS